MARTGAWIQLDPAGLKCATQTTRSSTWKNRPVTFNKSIFINIDHWTLSARTGLYKYRSTRIKHYICLYCKRSFTHHVKNLTYDFLRLSSLFPHITFSTFVRDLVVILDPELTFSHHLDLLAQIGLQYRITAMVSRCVLLCAPSCLCDLCCPVSVLAVRMVLRSAARGELLVPRAHLATVQRRAFSVVGPSARNDLPVELRSLLMSRPSKFYISLKSFFFGRDWAGSASEE